MKEKRWSWPYREIALLETRRYSVSKMLDDSGRINHRNSKPSNLHNRPSIPANPTKSPGLAAPIARNEGLSAIKPSRAAGNVTPMA
ncbi:C6 zinc finger domain-containing protein [Histoplasma capsulatum]|uniref:C6 zinc finger domain-containing protein n=1 Tax=Ajellomyces capsulatus TaxID=5037 RepID=A0A8A1MF10_AJECA|nr:C6 zinc finger domain-containing protein [Histoplasma capsulatum]